jgi:uncharacterized protein (DUF1499 family)
MDMEFVFLWIRAASRIGKEDCILGINMAVAGVIEGGWDIIPRY